MGIDAGMMREPCETANCHYCYRLGDGYWRFDLTLRDTALRSHQLQSNTSLECRWRVK